MSSPRGRPPFIDAVHAAEMLQVSQDTVLDWVKAGRLKPVGGKATNPFLRSADIDSLATELGVAADQPPKRTKSATARVQTRLTADARWSDVTDADLADWVTRADPSRRQAARTAARLATERLDTLLRLLEQST